MKVIYYFKILVATLFAMCVAMSCESSDDSGNGSDATVEEAFVLTPADGSTSDFKVGVQVTGDVVTYMVGVATVADFEDELDNDVNELADYILDCEKATDCDPTVIDDIYVFGSSYDVDLAVAWDLQDGTEYIIAAFGFDAEGSVCTPVSTAKASTEAVTPAEYSSYKGQIFINEIYVSGLGKDAIELYNAGKAVNLKGFVICDSKGANSETACTYESGSIGSEKFDFAVQNVDFNFTINKNGERITLLDPQGKIVDQIVAEPIMFGESYGRTTSGGDSWTTYASPTLGSANDTVVNNGESELGTTPKPGTGSADYNKWIGTWEVTSASAYDNGGPVTFEVVISQKIADKSYNLSGWDISMAREDFCYTVRYDSKNLVFDAETIITQDADYTYKAVAFGEIEDEPNIPYIITGSYDAMTAKMGADGVSATAKGYEGEVTGNIPFVITHISICAENEEGTYSFNPAAGLGGKDPKGPYTLVKIGEPRATAARTQGVAVKPINFDVVKSAINLAVNNKSAVLVK